MCLQSHLQSFTQPPQIAHSSASTLQVQFNSPPTTTPFKSLSQTYLMMTFCSMLLGSHRKTDYHPLFRNIVFKESCCQLIVFFSNSFRAFSPTDHLPQTFYCSLIHCPLHNLSFAFPSTFLKGSTKNQRLAKWAFMSSEGERRAGEYYKGQLQTSQIKNFIEHNAVMFVVHYNSTPYPNLNSLSAY